MAICVFSLFVVLSGAAVAADTIKIGAIYPFTGPMAGTAKMCRDGTLMAVDIINNKYGFDFLFADTEGIPSSAVLRLRWFSPTARAIQRRG